VYGSSVQPGNHFTIRIVVPSVETVIVLRDNVLTFHLRSLAINLFFFSFLL
jgi:hypothetical protein